MPFLLDTHMIASKPCRARSLSLALIVERLLHGTSKLAATRVWHTTLAEELDPAQVGGNEVYAAMDWLVARRTKKIMTAAEIGVRAGARLKRYKTGKHFSLQIGAGMFAWARTQASIDKEAALDGIDVIRMLAHYLEWHLRDALTPLLFDDETRRAANAVRDPVAPAQPSPAATLTSCGSLVMLSEPATGTLTQQLDQVTLSAFG